MKKIDTLVTLPLSEEVIQHIETMKSVMVKNNWMYITGKDARYFLMGDPYTPDNIITCINPMIVDHSVDMSSEIVETCNDHKGIVLSPKRFNWIRVRYTAINGNTDTIKFSGLTSVLFQHCMDHLNGIPFYSKVSTMQLDIAKRKAAKNKS